jgi:hypothetical protein
MEEEAEMRTKNRQIIINALLAHSQPQKGRFIGAFSLCKDYEDWKADAVKRILLFPDFFTEKGFLLSDVEVDTFFTDFEANVKGEIIEGGRLLEDSDPDDFQIDDRFEMEKVYPFSTLRKASLTRPDPKFTHFMILPVDYNRGGDDIGIAWLTKKGRKYYAQYLTGDY